MNKRHRIVVWSACGLLVGWMAVTLCRFALFGLPAEVHDTTCLSQDGVYQATLHEANTGAAGSYCQVVIRRTKDESKGVVLVDGPWEFISKVQWNSRRELSITTCPHSLPDPSLPKSWQDVKIVYREEDPTMR